MSLLLIVLCNLNWTKNPFSLSLIYKITFTMSSWNTILSFKKTCSFADHVQEEFVNKTT